MNSKVVETESSLAFHLLNDEPLLPVFALKEGNYTGEIVKQFRVSGAIINTTSYDSRHCKTGWHSHQSPHVCFAFQKGESVTHRNGRQFGDRVFYYHAGEPHRWIPHSSVSQSANIELGSEFLQFSDLAKDQLECAAKKQRRHKISHLEFKTKSILVTN